MTKTQRLVELMMRVYEKQKFTVDELAEEFDVSYRTMLRYLQELSGLGVPLYSEVGKNGGYSMLKPKSNAALDFMQKAAFKRVIKPITHIVGIEFKAPITALYMAQALLPRIWDELETRAHEISGPLVKEARIGLSLRSRVFHYIAGVEVANPHWVPENMVCITLPTHEYAAYTHLGRTSKEETEQTSFFLLQKLREQGLDHDTSAYTLEIFNPDNRKDLTVYIPLK